MGTQEIIPRHIYKEGDGGGGSLLGGVLGGLAGLAATVMTGGAAWPAIPALGGAGMSLGGIVGEEVDPTVSKTTKLVPARLENASKNNPMAQMAMLTSAQKSLGSTDLPQPVAEDYMSRMNQARGVLADRMKVGQEWF